MLDQYPHELNYAIKHYPIPGHRFARSGAMAALAAGKQGKFWEFHAELLENHDSLNEEKILEIAGKQGLDMEKFNQDRFSVDIQKIIEEDLANGKNVGVKGTPSVFMNGKRIRNREIGTLPARIMQEIEKKGKE